MKQTFSLILSGILLFCFAGCSANNNQDIAANGSESQNSESSETVETKQISYFTQDDDFEIIQADFESGTYSNNGEDYVAVRIRVQNHTDEDYAQVSIDGYGYDANGDQVCIINARIDELEAGRSAYSNNWMSISPVTVDNFGGVKFNHLEIIQRKDGKLVIVKKIDFDKKIDITKDEMNNTDN